MPTRAETHMINRKGAFVHANQQMYENLYPDSCKSGFSGLGTGLGCWASLSLSQSLSTTIGTTIMTTMGEPVDDYGRRLRFTRRGRIIVHRHRRRNRRPNAQALPTSTGGANGNSDEGYFLILILIPQPSPIRLVDGFLLMPGQTHLLFRPFCLFWRSTPLRGICIHGEAGKSGVARNTACHRTPRRYRRDGGLRDAAPAILECGGKRYSARHRFEEFRRGRIRGPIRDGPPISITLS